MSSPPPKHSLSSPTSGGSPSPVLPTPSSSSSASEVTNQLRRELEQQIAEKEKQLQDSTSGIGKSVIARQISQLKERLQEVDKRQPVSPNPIRRSQSPAEEDLSPATLEKLRNLERDLSAYRGYQQLSPSLSSSRKDKVVVLVFLPAYTEACTYLTSSTLFSFFRLSFSPTLVTWTTLIGSGSIAKPINVYHASTRTRPRFAVAFTTSTAAYRLNAHEATFQST